MIEIPDPPTVTACASCMSAISWCFSARSRQWFSVVRVDEDTMRVHRCRTADGWPSWRESRRGSPPSAEYVAAKAALQERTGEQREVAS